MSKFILPLLAMCFFLSCTDEHTLIESSTDTEDDQWVQKELISFPVEINDPALTYQLYYQFRYNNDYPYYNLWVNRLVYDAKGNLVSKKLQGMNLFNPTTGEPAGGGFGNYFDYKVLADSTYHFPEKGTYTIKIEQAMRQDTLNGIAAVGLQIIKNK